MPDFSIEDSFTPNVCGLDEVGRGPLAGPVVAACVVIPPDIRALPFIAKIKDSKKLSKPKLVELYKAITAHCPYRLHAASVEDIDGLNILHASMMAMAEAIRAMECDIAHALVDGNRLPPNLSVPATAVVKGDHVSTTIAAASIVAKVTRDRIMADLAGEFPHYGWDRNAAYPTREHLEAIELHGITPHHRRSFGPVKRYLERVQAV